MRFDERDALFARMAWTEGSAPGVTGNPWPLEAEGCYETWRRMGTDCGICIRTLPFANGLDGDEPGKAAARPGQLEDLAGRWAKPGAARPYDPNPPSWRR